MNFLQISDGFPSASLEEAHWNSYRFLAVFLKEKHNGIPKDSDGFPSNSSKKHNGIPTDF